MSKKAVEKYYKQICNQYVEMLQDIRDLEQEVAKGIVPPEFIDRLEEQIAPLKQNYERWAYMMFLLNQPQRKSKHPAYKERNKKFLNSLDTSNSIEATIAENESTLKHIGETK